MKNSEQFIEALGKLNSEYVDEYLFFQRKKRLVKINWAWKNIVKIAACFILIVGGFCSLNIFQHYQKGAFYEQRNDDLESLWESDSQETNTASAYIESVGNLYIPGGKIIDSSNLKVTSSSYNAPSVGTYFCFNEVNDELEKNLNDNVVFFLAVDVFSETKQLENDSDEMDLELTRLNQNGYHIGYAEYWTYEGVGQKVNKKYVAGYFTKEEIQNFIPSDSYGYTFYFMTNGDSSPVNSQQGIITDKK